MAYTIAFIGAKGGTLKSACTLSLGTEMARRGLHVGLVDCDPQGTTTRALPASDGPDQRAWAPVADPLTANSVPVRFDQLDFGGGSLSLFRSGPGLAGASHEAVLQHMRRARRGMDIVLLDTVPVLGDIASAAADAADLIIIPTAPTADDLDALPRVITYVRARCGDRKPLRVVLTKTNMQRRNTRDAIEMLSTPAAGFARLYHTSIPDRTTGESANGYLRPAVLYDRIVGDGSLSNAYRELTTEILTDIGHARREVA